MADMLNLPMYFAIVTYIILVFCHFVRRKIGMRHRPIYSLGNSLFSDLFVELFVVLREY